MQFDWSCFVVKVVKISSLQFLLFLLIALGKGPKIKKPESMVFDHTPLTPLPNLTYGLFLTFFLLIDFE